MNATPTPIKKQLKSITNSLPSFKKAKHNGKNTPIMLIHILNFASFQQVKYSFPSTVIVKQAPIDIAIIPKPYII